MLLGKDQCPTKVLVIPCRFSKAVCLLPCLFASEAGMRFSLGEHHPKSDHLLPTGEVRDRLADS